MPEKKKISFHINHIKQKIWNNSHRGTSWHKQKCRSSIHIPTYRGLTYVDKLGIGMLNKDKVEKSMSVFSFDCATKYTKRNKQNIFMIIAFQSCNIFPIWLHHLYSVQLTQNIHGGLLIRRTHWKWWKRDYKYLWN